MQYDLRVSARDYRLYRTVRMIIERGYAFGLNDQYHENRNRFLFVDV